MAEKKDVKVIPIEPISGGLTLVSFLSAQKRFGYLAIQELEMSALISVAITRFEIVTHTFLYQRKITESFTVFGKEKLLRHSPIQDVEISLGEEDIPFSMISARTGLISFFREYSTIPTFTASYTGGVGTLAEGVPSDLADSIFEFAEWSRSRKNHIGRRSVEIDSYYRTDVVQTIPPAVKQIWQSYTLDVL